ncbi:MAG: phytoene desaturase family protein, partial [Alkalispirochaeta sp.]
GVYYPRGGFSTITDAMVRLGSEFGVTYRTETPVSRVITHNGVVRGVETSEGETIEANTVVMNADYRHAELDLLSDGDRSYGESYWRGRTLAPAMFKFCFALNRRISGLAHHNLSFPRNWHEHFDSIFRNPGRPERPAFYLGHPSRTDRTIVPDDGDILFFLVPVAPGLDDSPERRQEFRAQVLRQFTQRTGEQIREGDIVFEQICTVSDCARYFNAPLGSALGLSHTLFQTAVFRPHIRSRRVRGLYYTGQMTQPGVGLPMVMISGEITAGAIAEDRRSRSVA